VLSFCLSLSNSQYWSQYEDRPHTRIKQNQSLDARLIQLLVREERSKNKLYLVRISPTAAERGKSSDAGERVLFLRYYKWTRRARALSDLNWHLWKSNWHLNVPKSAPRRDFPQIYVPTSERTVQLTQLRNSPPSAQKGLKQSNRMDCRPFERRIRRYSSCVCSATLYLCVSIFHTPCDTNRCTQRAKDAPAHSVMNCTRRRSIYELITHTASL
jgi:hypothetical protein